MEAEDIKFPDDVGLALSIARRFALWLKAERERTGMTETQILARADQTFDENDQESAAFLRRLSE